MNQSVELHSILSILLLLCIRSLFDRCMMSATRRQTPIFFASLSSLRDVSFSPTSTTNGQWRQMILFILKGKKSSVRTRNLFYNITDNVKKRMKICYVSHWKSDAVVGWKETLKSVVRCRMSRHHTSARRKDTLYTNIILVFIPNTALVRCSYTVCINDYQPFDVNMVLVPFGTAVVMGVILMFTVLVSLALPVFALRPLVAWCLLSHIHCRPKV